MLALSCLPRPGPCGRSPAPSSGRSAPRALAVRGPTESCSRPFPPTRVRGPVPGMRLGGMRTPASDPWKFDWKRDLYDARNRARTGGTCFVSGRAERVCTLRVPKLPIREETPGPGPRRRPTPAEGRRAALRGRPNRRPLPPAWSGTRPARAPPPHAAGGAVRGRSTALLDAGEMNDAPGVPGRPCPGHRGRIERLRGSGVAAPAGPGGTLTRAHRQDTIVRRRKPRSHNRCFSSSGRPRPRGWTTALATQCGGMCPCRAEEQSPGAPDVSRLERKLVEESAPMGPRVPRACPSFSASVLRALIAQNPRHASRIRTTVPDPARPSPAISPVRDAAGAALGGAVHRPAGRNSTGGESSPLSPPGRRAIRFRPPLACTGATSLVCTTATRYSPF